MSGKLCIVFVGIQGGGAHKPVRIIYFMHVNMFNSKDVVGVGGWDIEGTLNPCWSGLFSRFASLPGVRN